ncbi:hypothetical protein GCM10027186_23040 [Micromonospora schwarzwaldensis]
MATSPSLPAYGPATPPTISQPSTTATAISVAVQRLRPAAISTTLGSTQKSTQRESKSTPTILPSEAAFAGGNRTAVTDPATRNARRRGRRA